MKTMTALAAIGFAATLTCGTAAFAQSDLAQSDLPNIDVTAQRFHENASVAVTGRISAKDGNNLILSRHDGTMLAKIAEPTDNLGRYARLHSQFATVASRVDLGDKVTVFGHLRKADGMPYLIADAVQDNRTGRVMLTDTGDQNFADITLPAQLSDYQPFG